MKKILFLGVQALFLLGCSTPPVETRFDLNGSSQLQILNESPDSIPIVLDNWPYLPSDENQHLDTWIPPGKLLNLDITTQNWHYYNLTVDTQDFRLFTQPNMNNEIQVTDGAHRIRFSGKHKAINEFLAKRHPHSDWGPRTYWNQGGGSLAELLVAYDSITDRQKKELYAASNLPSWYSEFESLRLDYVNAASKLSSTRYRYKMLGIRDSIPKDFFKRVMGTLPIERADLAGVDIYMRFLGWYLTYQISPLPSKKNPAPNDPNQAFPLIRIETIEQSFASQEIKDVLLTEYFTHVIDKGRHVWQDEWLKHIHSPELSRLVTEQLQDNPLLPAGSDLPYFYLKDEEGKTFEPTDFKGKILLINFWATWCKACYKG
ncbi:MAG TPA: hypothetical protein DDW81_14675, partial [Cryomorphaceae bacterium]|nr:hypothetical protein [Cryomorphaceae bacterium]